MSKRVTLDDVASAAGVSRATASRALTGSGPASALARQRVEAAAESLGFTPHQAARALASSRAQAVALVIPEANSLVLADPFLAGIITGVSEAFHTTDYQLILVCVRPDDAPTKALRLLASSYVDGVIVASHHRTGSLEAAIEDSPAPLVYVGRPWLDDRAMYVDVDNRAGATLAARRLLERGARRIACVAGPEDMTPVGDRLDGWAGTLRQAGVEPGPVAHETFTTAGGAAAMTRVLDVRPDIDGVFAQSDLLAAGAIRVLQQRGRVIGRDVFVVGFDDSEVARTTTPALTSVTNPPAELALRASRMLLRVLGGVSPSDVTPEIISPSLVVRESA